MKLFVYVPVAIPVAGRGGLWDCEMSRIPHFLDNRLTDRNPSSRTMALGLTQLLPEMFLRSRARPARKADSLTAICEPIV
jgi:hypothetical protein